MRARQKEATRANILEAALHEFSTHGFDGTSTREIAERAQVHHALIKYHFQSKDALWRAAVTFLFDRQLAQIELSPRLEDFEDKKEYARAMLRQRVYYWAQHPEHARLMVQESCRDTERFRWMVDTFIMKTSKSSGAFVQWLQDEGIVPPASLPALVYILVGAAQLFYTLAPEVQRVWGLDPTNPAAIEAHVDALVRLVIR
ncbi:TetR/AcrR family transcriptional regulator [Sphingomonas lycopersici]|uniref:TetR family transcriptional regulator n=1 Tax=Sphingomonas lycopersici TaxID=2951807 RepID=A0AA42CVC2_9SPHN|nr:TetR family transcriptional regulator [Sphingomonas lycopersici]MCW6536418.1 TetR family transcriptional regulator [Sphingomonas lycopersici]